MEPITKYDPEEEKIRQENLAARQKGYTMKGVRALYRAVAEQAILDYAKADKAIREGKEAQINGKDPRSIKQECAMYFNEPIFKAVFGFSNPVEVREKARLYQIVKDEILEETRDLSDKKRDQKITEIFERHGIKRHRDVV